MKFNLLNPEHVKTYHNACGYIIDSFYASALFSFDFRHFHVTLKMRFQVILLKTLSQFYVHQRI